MIMDSRFNSLPDFFDDINVTDETTLPGIEQSLHDGQGLELVDDSLNIDFMHNQNCLSSAADIGVPLPSVKETVEVNHPHDHESDPMLAFVNQILLEESIEEKHCMSHDPRTLHAAEKSFYDAIGEKYPPSHTGDFPTNVDVNDASSDRFFRSTTESRTTSSNSGGSSVDHLWNLDPGGIVLSAGKSQPSNETQPFINPISSSRSSYKGQIASSSITNLVPSIFSDTESMLLFQKGMEEAKKFLPTNNQLDIGLYHYTLPSKSEEGPPKVTVKENSESSNRGKKHLHQQDSELERQGSTKQSAVYEEEVELSELFDKVLLCDVGGFSSSKKASSKEQGVKIDAVDLRTLLTNCAWALASNDHRATNEHLKKIREHASSTGDGFQRLANILSNGIEARLAGTGTQIHAASTSKKISALEKLKAYQVCLLAAPFVTISMYFANEMILKTAAKASTLHIVSFGIEYGFQWPMLIQLLSRRQGGPPKLRITGIEFPEPGFRPTKMLEETGNRLAKYCERFGVPFEYQAIATKSWEKINIDDLKLARDEVLAVNVLHRFKNLLDETVLMDSPRDGTLNLIRKMKPDIFALASVNGSFNSPFFVTRFRETLLFYSSLFDMLDVTLLHDDQQRFNIETVFHGQMLMNIIACEGPERVERPETYKQWQCRIMRAGLKPLPIDKDIVKILKDKVEARYHKDFVFDDDRYWMLQGWKGRLLYASSCWVPG